MESAVYTNPDKKSTVEKTRHMLASLEAGTKMLPPTSWLGGPDMCWGLLKAEGRVCFWSTTPTTKGKVFIIFLYNTQSDLI